MTIFINGYISGKLPYFLQDLDKTSSPKEYGKMLLNKRKVKH